MTETYWDTGAAHVVEWMVRRTPSVRGDVLDPRAISERRALAQEIAAEAEARGLGERYSYALRTR